MALTSNQEKLLLRLFYEKLQRGDTDLDATLIQLANATEAQVVTRIKQYAAERKAQLQEQRTLVTSRTLASLDAEIAFLEAED